MKIKDVTLVNVLYDAVLVKFPKMIEKKEEDEPAFTESEGGVLIPKGTSLETKKEEVNMLHGEVVKVGFGYVNSADQKETVALHVAKGDWIVIDKRNNANNTVFDSAEDGFEYRIIREQNILMSCQGKEVFLDMFNVEEKAE